MYSQITGMHLWSSLRYYRGEPGNANPRAGVRTAMFLSLGRYTPIPLILNLVKLGYEPANHCISLLL
jgi:hypothetical protein